MQKQILWVVQEDLIVFYIFYKTLTLFKIEKWRHFSWNDDASIMYQAGINDSSRHTIHDFQFHNFDYPSNFNPYLQSQFGGLQPHPQWQMPSGPSISQQHSGYGSVFPFNASQCPSSTIGLSGSSPSSSNRYLYGVDLLFLMSFTAQQISSPLFASNLLFSDVKSL